MPPPTHVVPESMRAGGAALTQTAQQMASGLTALQGTIQGGGNPWGADEQGSLFGQLYQAVLGKAFEAIVSHVEQVGHAGQALTAQAQMYAKLETDMASGFGKTAAQLG